MTDRLEVRATVRRDDDMWIIDIDDWGVTQAHRLSEVEFMARDYVACLADIDRSDIAVSVASSGD